jgi:SET domain-containing protein
MDPFSFILRPSPIEGVGVFAAHDIAAGEKVLTGKFTNRKLKTKEIPEEFLRYCIFINDEECICPEKFDRMEIGWFLNHSNDPNIAKIADEAFIAIRDIKRGDEILIDYNKLDEPEHLKKEYYNQSKNFTRAGS